MLLTPRHLAKLCVATAVAGALVPASGAFAADEIGTVAKDSSGTCSDQARFVVAASDDSRVPYDGIVTKLRSENMGTPGTPFAYRMARYDGPGRYVGVGTVPATVGAGGAVEVPARLPVRQGDHLGISKAAGTGLKCIHGGTHDIGTGFGNPADGESFSTYVSPIKAALNVVATIERDADGDGFGDETQDACAGAAGPDGGCAPPEAPRPADPVEPQRQAPVAVCTVPKLKGLKLKAAKRRLRDAGCAAGKVKKGKAAKKAKPSRLRIRRQSVPVGTTLAAGSKVRLTVKVKKARR